MISGNFFTVGEMKLKKTASHPVDAETRRIGLAYGNL